MRSTTASALIAQFAAAVTALSAVSKDSCAFQAQDDAVLVELSRLAAQQKQLAEANLALVAGEIAARSTRELGQSGLAQREGFRSVEEFVRVTTGATGREAVTAVRVGRMVRDASLDGSTDPATGETFEAAEPWLLSVAAAVAAGSVSVAAAVAIRTGLGLPTENVDAASLALAAQQLCAEAATLDPDRLQTRARELRDDLDDAGIADRERERFERRSLKHYRLPNGMGRITWDLDPESYAIATDLYDRATSPKHGVRFVSGSQKETAERILDDPRTIAQLASDTMLGLLQAGADADSTRILGSGGASIRVLVTKRSLDGRDGHGHIEGSPDPISLESVERLTCGGATTTVDFDTSGQPLDVGYKKRLFTKRQKIALAVRDGGCLFGTCERPPSMTEAHHIRFWARDNGRTDVRDGVCLCKFHHLLVHNNHWEIERVGSVYYLIPPPDIDPAQTPVLMPSKSAALRDLQRENSADHGRELAGVLA
jgi:hypothetical protein